MTTPVSICSSALLMLGDNPINSFSDPTDRARMAAATWDQARDFVLRSHPWNCAVKRVTLAPTTTAPAFEWSYAFTLPGDCLRVLSVGLDGERPPYKVEGREILMMTNVCQLRYVWRNDNPATWDSMLVWGMTNVMRSIFAYGLTQSGSLEQLVQQVLQPLIRQAQAVDGSEDENEALDDSPLIAARYIGRRW